MFIWSLFLLALEGSCTKQSYPYIAVSGSRYFKNPSGTGYFRALLVDSANSVVYVGASDAIIKLKISSKSPLLDVTLNLTDSPDIKPNLNDPSAGRKWWTTVTSTDNAFRKYEPIRQLLLSHNIDDNDIWKDLNLQQKLGDYLGVFTYGLDGKQNGNSVLDTALQYSTIYQSADVSFKEHCIRQAAVIKLYYGDAVKQPVDDIISLCSYHIRGLAFYSEDKASLFAVRTGMFGTLPLSATGTNSYAEWAGLEANLFPFLISCVLRGSRDGKPCAPPPGTNPPYNPSAYSGIITDPPELSSNDSIKGRNSFVMPSPENYIGKTRNCDFMSAPNRIILSDRLGVLKSDVLIGDREKESCVNGLLAQLFLGGFHPDQTTLTLYSSKGNGPASDKEALYVITEIGQEKQLDLMLDYLNLPELYPLTSSQSMSIVRLLIDRQTGDIDPKSITVSNPFKYSWVTSPLNRFGRLDKTGSQEQVAYAPKPVGLFEDSDFVYFFFREADWDRTPLAPYKIRRHHFKLNAYSHALYYPWEKEFIDRQFIKHQEEPGSTYEELYAPTFEGWRHMNKNLQITSRVARICKNDASLPMGLQDANLFDLDYKLSLQTFQTFLKTRLICSVPVAGVPFVWRLRKDESRINDTGDCLTEVGKSDNLYSKDLHYRQVSRSDFVTKKYNTASSSGANPILKYYYMSNCKGYKWSYVPKPVTQTALYVDYPELRHLVQIKNVFYGVFSTALVDEQLHTAENTDSNLKPAFGSAVCSFSIDDIKQAFQGPFKRRDPNGAWRPFDPRTLPTPLDPDPYSCVPDVVAKTASTGIKNMTIDFLDPTQPYEEEIRRIDLRKVSGRLRFFEEDVVGTRTMWTGVKTNALLSDVGVVYEKIAAEVVNNNVTLLYLATEKGLIYKVSTWDQEPLCVQTKADDFVKWLNRTASMSSIWDNEFYAYLNKTLDSKTFAATFQSSLTMEKNTAFPNDMLLTSDWQCTPKTMSYIVSVYKPFDEIPTKIWDMKLLESSLIVSTDEQVLQVPVVQCSAYTHCITCSRDPHCGWNNGSNICQPYAPNLIQSVTSNPGQLCSCQKKSITADLNSDVVLEGIEVSATANRFTWRSNDTDIVYRKNRVMLAQDYSLIIFNFSESDSGTYVLWDNSMQRCLVQYVITTSSCKDDIACQFRQRYNDWCNEYERFLDSMSKWQRDYDANGYCSNI